MIKAESIIDDLRVENQHLYNSVKSLQKEQREHDSEYNKSVNINSDIAGALITMLTDLGEFTSDEVHPEAVSYTHLTLPTTPYV